MNSQFVKKLPFYISILFCIFISLLSVSDDNRIVSNIYYTCFALFIALILIEKKNIFNKTSLYLIAFLEISAISTLWSAHPTDTYRYIQHGLYIFIFSCIIYELRDLLFSKGIMFKSYVITCAIFIIANGFMFYSNHSLNSRFYPVFGPSNTIDYSGILCLGIIFSCYIIQSEPSIGNKLFYGAMTITLLIGVILSQSRTPMIALAISLAILFIKDKRSTMISLLIAVFAVIVFYFIFPSIFTRDSVDGAPTPRVFTWIYTFQQVKEHHPWLGFGYNNIFAHYFQPRNTTYNNAHSVFMSIFYYSGIIGSLLFCCYIYNLMNTAVKVFHKNRYPMALLLISLIFSSTQGYLYIYHPREIWITLWFPLFLIIPISKLFPESK